VSAAPSKPTKRHLNGKALGEACVQGDCASDSYCTNGKCACTDGWTPCGGVCFDLSRDWSNCGRCGHRCGKKEECSFGKCARP
jgi:hypothetical protein